MVRTRSKAHSQEFMNAFAPVRIFLTVIGQLPFHIQKRPDGTFAFRFKKRSHETVLFGIFSVIYCLSYLMTSFWLIVLLLDFWEQGWYKSYTINVTDRSITPFPAKQFHFNATKHPWEQVMLKNHFAIVLVTHSMLTMTFAGIIFIVLNETQYVHYFNYWNKVVQAVHMNPTSGVRRQLRVRIITTILYVVVEVLIFWFMVGLRAVSGIYACLLLKPVLPNLPEKSWFILAEVVGFCFIVYGHLGARAIIIQFIFFCILLNNVSSVWNERLRHVLHRSKDESVAPEHRRHEFRCLLKDHLVIVQLFKMTESTFSILLSTFFLTNLICIIYEVFALWKLFLPNYENTEVFNITADGTPSGPPAVAQPAPFWTKDLLFDHQTSVSEGLLILFLLPTSALACYSVISYAHTAYIEAMQGFQIIRRHGLMDCAKSERNFIYSMIVSYARNNPLIVSANGYFLLNKALLLALVAAVMSYFILLIQFPESKFSIKEKDYRLNWGPPQ